MLLITLLAFVWATLWAVLSVRRMARGDRSITHPILLVIYIFLALPLFYDVLWGRPNLRDYPGIELAQDDDLTSSLYILYVVIIFPIFYAFARIRAGKIEAPEPQSKRFQTPETIKIISVVLLVSPSILVLLSPDPAVYATFGLASRDTNTDEFRDFHSLVALSTRLATISAVVLILSARRITLGFVLVLVAFLVPAAWFHSKRSAFAFMLVCFLYAFWQRGMLRGKYLLVAGLAAAVGLGTYSVVYQTEVRGDREFASSYEGFRLDYGRDTTVKLAIYSLKNPDKIQIIEPYETLPLYAGQLVPREWWPDKPYPYAVYVTSATFLEPPRLLGWGLTTSWFGEWLSNIGWSAFFVAPALLGYLCRLGDRITMALPRIIVTVVLMLLVVVQVGAFSFLVPLALLAAVWDIYRSRMVKSGSKKRIPVNYPRKNSRLVFNQTLPPSKSIPAKLEDI